MATRKEKVKIKAHKRADGSKVKAHTRKVNRRQSSSPEKRRYHSSEMRRIGKELRKNKDLSSEQRNRLERQATFHGVKAGKITLI